jgi:hypothetical protein
VAPWSSQSSAAKERTCRVMLEQNVRFATGREREREREAADEFVCV